MHRLRSLARSRAWAAGRSCSIGAMPTPGRELSVAGHVEELLIPLLRNIGEPVALVGYCLGGTMAIAAANLVACERVVTLAAPWKFSRYPGLIALRAAGHVAPFRSGQPRSRRAPDGGAPGELLVARPRTDRKQVRRVRPSRPRSADARRFVELEDWANEGEPLPYPAARDLIEDLFGRDLPGSGQWRVGGRVVTHDSLFRCSTSPPGATASPRCNRARRRNDRHRLGARRHDRRLGPRTRLHEALEGLCRRLAAESRRR